MCCILPIPVSVCSIFKSSATHSYHQCVRYFRVSRQCCGCRCLGFLTRPQMLMHDATAMTRGLYESVGQPPPPPPTTDSVKESLHWNWNLALAENKNKTKQNKTNKQNSVCCTAPGDSNPRQYCGWLFSRTLYQLNYNIPTPWVAVEASKQVTK